MSPIVTTHAVDRYQQRFPGAETDRSEAQRAIAALVANGVDQGASGVRVSGFTFKLAGPVVVTVYRGRHRFLEQQDARLRRRIAHEARA